MSDLSDDYKKRYEIRWNEDLNFSKRFTPIIMEILDKTTLPKKIKDNVGTESNLKGHDLTVTLQIGVRIRRYSYVDFDDFTEDDKERDTMEDHVYFFGYSLQDESGLYSYIIFDHHDFRKARENNLLRTTRRRNRKHGLAWFTCYPTWDIRKHCKIYGESGEIGDFEERDWS